MPSKSASNTHVKSFPTSDHDDGEVEKFYKVVGGSTAKYLVQMGNLNAKTIKKGS